MEKISDKELKMNKTENIHLFLSEQGRGSTTIRLDDVKKMCAIARALFFGYRKSTNSRFTVHNFNFSRNHVSHDSLYSYIIQLENL